MTNHIQDVDHGDFEICNKLSKTPRYDSFQPSWQTKAKDVAQDYR